MVLLNLFFSVGTKLQYDFAIEDDIFKDNFPNYYLATLRLFAVSLRNSAVKKRLTAENR